MSQEKENIAPEKMLRNRKSLKNVPHTNSFIKMEQERDVSDKFSSYIEYVRQLEEAKENLSAELQSIYESKALELQSLKDTYDEELRALRNAVDDLATEKASVEYENQSIKEELDELNGKYTQKCESEYYIQKKFDEIEEQYLHAKRKVKSLETVQQDYEILQKKYIRISDDLKSELRKKVELENKTVTLTEEVDFYRKLGSPMNQSSVSNLNESREEKNKSIELYTNKYDDMVEEFEERINNMNDDYQTKFKDLENLNASILEKNRKYSKELRGLKVDYDNLIKVLSEKNNEIHLLNSKISLHQEEISCINKKFDEEIRLYTEENEALQNEMKDKIVEINKLCESKINIENELYTIKSLLEGEHSRCNISSPISAKRRKVEAGNTKLHLNYIISAKSSGRVKMACEDNYQGDFVWIYNDTENAINISQWKLVLSGSSFSDIQYTFPEKNLMSHSQLNVWSSGKNVEEDQNNFVLNINLPEDHNLTCTLNNDMGEIEAEFELRKKLKRKRKADEKTNMEKCLIM